MSAVDHKKRVGAQTCEDQPSAKLAPNTPGCLPGAASSPSSPTACASSPSPGAPSSRGVAP
eukprot:2356772-Alexandrium_andersonii.AAC.1